MTAAVLLIVVILISVIFRRRDNTFRTNESHVDKRSSLHGIVNVVRESLALTISSSRCPKLPSGIFRGRRVNFMAATNVPGGDCANRSLATKASLRCIACRVSNGFLGHRIFSVMSGSKECSQRSEGSNNRRGPVVVGDLRTSGLIFSCLPRGCDASARNFLPSTMQVSTSISTSNSTSVIDKRYLKPSNEGSAGSSVCINNGPGR